MPRFGIRTRRRFFFSGLSRYLSLQLQERKLSDENQNNHPAIVFSGVTFASILNSQDPRSLQDEFFGVRCVKFRDRGMAV